MKWGVEILSAKSRVHDVRFLIHSEKSIYFMLTKASP